MKYEQKYKEAIKRAKKIHDETEFDYEKGMIEEIFPELAESEDERVKNLLIKHLERERGSLSNDEAVEAISWIKKQAEQKHVWNEDDEQYLLVCKNALVKYQTTDKWDANIIYNWLKNKLQKNYDNQRKS